MNVYSISEAIVFLAQEYGENNMPASEETLRRAIRTKKLIAQEDGDPGRKGYTISEKDLRAYAENRMNRVRNRERTVLTGNAVIGAADVSAEADHSVPVPFPELFSQYIDGKISSSTYYKDLFLQRTKWEQIMHEKQIRLAQLNAQMVALQSDIQTCQSAVEAYSDGISKYNPQGG